MTMLGEYRWLGLIAARTTVLCVSILVIGACSGKKVDLQDRRISSIRPTPANIEVQELQVKRADLQAALRRDDLVRRIRLVEIFTTAAAGVQTALPEYRLFDIYPGSVYALLGLRSADVLVSANDRILVNASVFIDYIRLLANESEAQIEIRRVGRPVLLKYRFVD